MNTPMPFMPQVPNTHAVIERIAKNQVEAHRQLMERLDRLIALQEKQNELLLQLAQAKPAQE